MERIELSCHTTLSRMDGLIPPPKLVNYAWENGYHAIAITDYNSVQAFWNIEQAVQSLKYRCEHENGQFDFKVMYGLETNLEDGSLVHLIARNQEGLKALYRLVELAYQKSGALCFLYKSEIVQYRDDIFVGCPGEDGELYHAILASKSETDIADIVDFYDFLEVLPPNCYRLLSASERFPNNEVLEMEDVVREIISAGVKFHKPVAAAGNVRFLCSEDTDAYRILKTEKDVPPLYFRSTEDMIDAFAFLGDTLAREIVIEAPNRLLGFCKEVKIFSDEQLYSILPNAYETIKALCLEKLQALYGDCVPPAAKERLALELSFLENKEVSCSIIVIFRHLALEFQKRGILFSLRGCAAASFIAYLLGISDVNPLTLHISCETLFGGDGDAMIDIDINLQSGCFENAREILAEIFPSNILVQAGYTRYVDSQIAPSICRDYIVKYGNLLTDNQLKKIEESMHPVKRNFHILRDHFIIAPNLKAAREIMPVCHLNDHSNFLLNDYYPFENNLFKIDILPATSLDLLKRLENLTGVSNTSFNPKTAVPMLLRDPTDIPEFDTSLMQGIWKLATPQGLDDLIKLNALSHSTGAWYGNAEVLLQERTASINEVIGSRDDVFFQLLDAGVSRQLSYTVMDYVRKGKGLKEEWIPALLKAGIPAWFLESCNKISYLFPKAHSACHTMVALRAAWFKAHFPKLYAHAYAELYSSQENM